MSDKLRALMFLLIATFIWGLSYPIGRAALEHLEPLAYGGFRYLFGALSLLPLALKRRRQPAPLAYSGNISPHLWLWGGMLGGLTLSIGAALQLYGMAALPASQVGFMTTLYVSLVPVLAFVTGVMPRLLIGVGLAVGLFGLYLLTGGAGTGFDKKMLLVLAADVFWAIQVIITGHYAAKVNTWLFSLAQAATGFVITMTFTVMTGSLPTLTVFVQTLPYTAWGIFSVGVAYSCQAMAQRDMSPTSAALIFPLQSVIGAVAGVIFLGEHMSERMIIGAGVIILGCVIAQFARESTRITPDSKYWRPIKVARIAVGSLITVATVGGLIWAVT